MSTSSPVKEMNPSVFVPEGIKRIAIRVRGLTPLLFNKISDKTMDGLIDSATGRKNKSKPDERTPRQVAESKLHLDHATDQVCVPARMLLSCLCEGGKFIKMEGKSKMSNATSSRIPGFLSIEEMNFPINKQQWEVDIQPAYNINAGKSVAVASIRPRFDQWQFNCTIQIDTEQVTEKEIRNLFEISLSRIGLGSSRVKSGHGFGKSCIDNWKLL